jgi:hypothetical protein
MLDRRKHLEMAAMSNKNPSEYPHTSNAVDVAPVFGNQCWSRHSRCCSFCFWSPLPQVYIDILQVSRIKVSLSFTPAPWRLLTPATPTSPPGAPAAGASNTSRAWASGSHSRRAELSHPGGTGASPGAGVAAAAAAGGPHDAAAQQACLSRAVISKEGGQQVGKHHHHGAPGGRAGSVLVRLLLSLAHLEGTWLRLKPLRLRHPLQGYDGLLQVRHGVMSQTNGVSTKAVVVQCRVCRSFACLLT